MKKNNKMVNVQVGDKWPNHVSSFKEFQGIGGAYFVVDESGHTHVLLFKPSLTEDDRNSYKNSSVNIRIYEYRNFLVTYFVIGEEVFPSFFSPHKYFENQKLRNCLKDISDMTIYFIDSVEFTVQSIIASQIPVEVIHCWHKSWDYMHKVENGNEVYYDWIRRKGLNAIIRMLKEAKDYGVSYSTFKEQSDITLLLKASLEV